MNSKPTTEILPSVPVNFRKYCAGTVYHEDCMVLLAIKVVYSNSNAKAVVSFRNVFVVEM